MNCTECRDHLIACVEGLLEAEPARQCQAHLENCAACRAECDAIARLQGRLVAHGRLAGEVSLADSVMRRVQRERSKTERNSFMSKLFHYRWGLGLGAAGAAAAALVFALAPSPAYARAQDVLARGARALARVSTIHLRGQLRTRPGDNFSYIDANQQFYPIELWKQFGPDLKWRVEKPYRVVVMDGQSTLMLMKGDSDSEAVKIPKRTNSAFDTDWLQRIANLSNTISNELKHAQAKGWQLDLAEQTGADGRAKSIVTVHAKSGLPDDDYVKNSFIQDSDTRRVYRFDAQSERLEAVQLYLERAGGEVQIFDLSQIDYDQPIDAAVWQLDLPANVSWYQEAQVLPDNEKYAAMTAEQAARAFFEACGHEDWNEVAKFISPVNAGLKQYLGGVEIVSLGKAFASKAYGGQFVPYEIKLRGADGVKKHNLALRKDNPAKRWQVDGGI